MTLQDQKVKAWDKVWEQLKVGNPVFFEAEGTGVECALAEIRRLQKIDGLYNAKCDETVRLKFRINELEEAVEIASRGEPSE
jgi:hypothetical protein